MGRETGGCSGRSSDDPTVLHSSIALLQERFRQLQRVKEMREERELMRVFCESERTSPPAAPRCEQQPKWFLHPDLVHPSRPIRGPKPVRPKSSAAAAEHPEYPASGGSLSMGLWPDTPINVHNLNGCDEMDVDTSLHL